jgi:16S rRNA (cytosine1407-C5)-methyltransferase
VAAGVLPDKFLERLEQVVPPARLAGVLASFAAEKAVTIRVNSWRARPEDVVAELAAAGVTAHLVAGLHSVYRAAAADRDRLTRSAPFSQGRLYVQNMSSLLPAPVLSVEPGMAVLDLAAAPGGKTLHRVDLMNNTGAISAVESARERFFRLRHNLRLHGATCCRAYLKDGRRVGRACPDRFDRVLLDAPCSGEAQLRSAGEARLPNWSVRKIGQCAGKQRALLLSAVAACRPGGLVGYCTCSTAPEENEAVVASVLAECPGILEVEPVPLPPVAVPVAVPGLRGWAGRELPPDLTFATRILPDDWFDAFFLCRLRKL